MVIGGPGQELALLIKHRPVKLDFLAQLGRGEDAEEQFVRGRTFRNSQGQAGNQEKQDASVWLHLQGIVAKGPKPFNHRIAMRNLLPYN